MPECLGLALTSTRMKANPGGNCSEGGSQLKGQLGPRDGVSAPR